MSKLVTDSEFLMDFLFDGSSPDDTPLGETVNNLKQAAFDCTELRVTCQYDEPEVIREKLDSVSTVLVETWHYMLAMRNDFKDLIEKNFRE